MLRNLSPQSWLCGLAWLAAAAAHASPQSAGTARAGDVSAFDGYRSYQDQPVRPWAEVNDEVRRIGGWRAYAREASETTERHIEQRTEPAPAGGERQGHHPHH